ncbi:MAG: methylated-DNA--[protein]-cysteine S-methyltransferase [Dehalococcoidia bacterium]|nr:methylated-DNA--[protein]-cysteine S-methyltransferase [Dehalococcoidia bacterium]
MTFSTTPIVSTVVEVNFGWVGLAGSTSGIRFLTLPRARQQDCLEEIDSRLGPTLADPEAFGDLPTRLRGYFLGELSSFPDLLDLTGTTSFCRSAWLAAQAIPYGQTRSYAWVAEKLGRPGGARAVGQAMGANSIPLIIPCHRVIGSNGHLRGFGGGLAMKERLLRLEGALR